MPEVCMGFASKKVWVIGYPRAMGYGFHNPRLCTDMVAQKSYGVLRDGLPRDMG
ncbi:hypothetical protein L208DRAFT_1401152 [Tricholoma matsutake]|nr:hypothetical protein L208DRAFT_1401152 [Tricholoma matsutake 945]